MKFGVSREEKVQKAIERMVNNNYDNVDAKTIKKENNAIKVCVSVLSFFLAITIAVFSVINHYLSKINYGDIEAVAEADAELERQLDSEEEIDFDIVDYSEIGSVETTTTQANKSIKNTSKKGTSSKSNSSNNRNTTTRRYNSTQSTNLTGTQLKIIEKKEDLSNSSIGKEIQKQANEDIAENISDDVLWYSEDVYNILIAGYDAGATDGATENTPKFYRSDAMIIASINKVKKSIRLISLSRATYAAIPGHGNKRLNTAHAYGGASLLVETIEMNYKVRIDRYVTANFEGFKSIIDTLGGITLELTKEEADFAFDDDTLPAGKYTMNGKQALRYVRLRKTDSDRVRTGRQRKVLNEILTRAKNMNTSQQLAFMDAVLPYITTNFSKSELVSKLSEFNTYASWPVSQYIVPKKANQYEMRDGLEVIIVDWAETTKYIHSIMYDGVKAKTV
ncbi:MAG: LCP family protein [Acutalibacteraceae bacterium]